jgi:hypothetical protein
MKRALAFALFAAACSNSKPDVSDDFSGIADEKSDSFSSKMSIAATLSDPSGSVQISYSPKPLYRAIKLHGLAGDIVRITVGAPPAVKGAPPPDAPDPVTWLLDSRFKVVAKNDDANDNTRNSQIVTQLRKSGTFYVVIRDYNYATVNVSATLELARVSGDLVSDANSWFALFFTGDDLIGLTDQYAIPLGQMPQAAQDDANGFFTQDLGAGAAHGYFLPYGANGMYFLIGNVEEAYDARPYDADGNPIADTAIGGDAGDILFGPKPPRGTK